MRNKALLVIACVLFFIGFNNVQAAPSASVNIKVSSSNIMAGQRGSATVTISANERIGQLYGTFSCGGLGSKSLMYNIQLGNTPSKSRSYTISFTAKTPGTYTCKVSGVEVGGLESGDWAYPSASSKTITIQPDNRSTNNALKSLSVEGQSISPDFDANTTDYKLSVTNEVKSIDIKATAADSKSKVTGTGKKDLQIGNNKFDIVVTAENGSQKTYTLNVEVDTKPIIVKINGEKLNLIKKKEELPELLIAHEDLTLNIEEQDIPAYRIDKLGYVLVGLKDSKGKIKLYKFDSKKGDLKNFKYTLFKYVISPSTYIAYADFPKKLIPLGYKKYTEDINGEKASIYKFSKNSRYGLFYGINMETGKKNIYKYDTKEGTMQVYDNTEDDQLNLMKAIILGLIGLSGLLFIIIIIVIATRNRKIKKALRKYAEKLKIRQEAR